VSTWIGPAPAALVVERTANLGEPYHGSMANRHLNAPITALVAHFGAAMTTFGG
jgi:hypothetical protein